MNVNTMKRFSATLFAAVMIAGISAEVKVSSLEVEGFKAPLNIENDNPRLSWIITSDKRNVAQTGYRILVASSPEMLSSGLWPCRFRQIGRSVLQWPGIGR